MNWAASPTGTRGRQPVYADAAIQTCLTLKVLLGMAFRQATGFVESLLDLIGLQWAVPDFSTLSRRQKTLAVNLPFWGSQGPLHLLIDSTGIKVEGEGSGTRANMVTPNAASGARFTSVARQANGTFAERGDRRANVGNPGCRGHNERRG